MGRKNAESKGDDNAGILGNTEIEDVRWLCSLSESELDFLIGLKMMVIRRAKRIDHESLAKHFNLKMLRGFSYTMMEYLKEQLKDSLDRPDFPDSSKILDKCKLLQLLVEESFSSMSSEELWPSICPDKKKRQADMRDRIKLMEDKGAKVSWLCIDKRRMTIILRQKFDQLIFREVVFIKYDKLCCGEKVGALFSAAHSLHC